MSGLKIRPALICGCRALPYKTLSSFQAHFKSQRHQSWSTDQALHECRLQIMKLEQENLRLTRVIDELVMNRPRGAVTTRRVSTIQKKKVAAAQHWKCGRCHCMLDELYETDHIVPLFKGGTNDADNLQALCPDCHACKTGRERSITCYMTATQ